MILNRDEKGFTLLEILLSLVILSILVLAVSNTFITGFDVWNYNADKINMQQINRIIGMRMASDIRTASEIFAPNLPEELRISFGITRDDGTAGMIFGLNNNELYYQKVDEDGNTGNRMSLTSRNEIIIRDLQFNYHAGEKIIEVTFTIDNGHIERDFVERIKLRNTNVSLIAAIP